jgi:hypothetical protein
MKMHGTADHTRARPVARIREQMRARAAAIDMRDESRARHGIMVAALRFFVNHHHQRTALSNDHRVNSA